MAVSDRKLSQDSVRPGLHWGRAQPVARAVAAVRLRAAARLAAAASVVWFACAAYPATVAFRVTGEGAERRATAELVARDGVDYVSLAEICEGLGAGMGGAGTRAQVDFAGASARVTPDDALVTSTYSTFRLGRPILRDGEHILIAASDVAPFLAKAFRVRVVQERAEAERTPAPGAIEDFLQEDEDESAYDWRTASSSGAINREAASEPGGSNVDVIVIDAGHGGDDAGCVGPSGLKEKDLTLAVALELNALLEQSPSVASVLTREEDKGMLHDERVRAAVQAGGTLLVSLHAGASFSKEAQGFELFHSGQSTTRQGQTGGVGQGLAGRREPERAAAFSEAIRDGIRGETGAPFRGMHEASCRVWRDLPMPGLLVELGCVTHPEEEARLQDGAFRAQLARGLAKGLRAAAVAAAETSSAPVLDPLMRGEAGRGGSQ